MRCNAQHYSPILFLLRFKSLAPSTKLNLNSAQTTPQSKSNSNNITTLSKQLKLYTQNKPNLNKNLAILTTEIPKKIKRKETVKSERERESHEPSQLWPDQANWWRPVHYVAHCLFIFSHNRIFEPFTRCWLAVNDNRNNSKTSHEQLYEWEVVLKFHRLKWLKSFERRPKWPNTTIWEKKM